MVFGQKLSEKGKEIRILPNGIVKDKHGEKGAYFIVRYELVRIHTKAITLGRRALSKQYPRNQMESFP